MLVASTSIFGLQLHCSQRTPPSRPRASARTRAWARNLANLIDRIVNPSQNNVVALRVLPWLTTSTSHCSSRAWRSNVVPLAAVGLTVGAPSSFTYILVPTNFRQ